MTRALVVMTCALLASCQIISYDPPYAGPLWGDACLTDKGPTTVSGCTHPSDGTGDPGWHSEIELGLCAPPSRETLGGMSPEQRRGGYTGACRPFCDLGADGSWSCPQGGAPTLEVHGLASGLEFCYCADPAVDDMSTST